MEEEKSSNDGGNDSSHRHQHTTTTTTSRASSSDSTAVETNSNEPANNELNSSSNDDTKKPASISESSNSDKFGRSTGGEVGDQSSSAVASRTTSTFATAPIANPSLVSQYIQGVPIQTTLPIALQIAMLASQPTIQPTTQSTQQTTNSLSSALLMGGLQLPLATPQAQPQIDPQQLLAQILTAQRSLQSQQQAQIQPQQQNQYSSLAIPPTPTTQTLPTSYQLPLATTSVQASQVQAPRVENQVASSALANTYLIQQLAAAALQAQQQHNHQQQQQQPPPAPPPTQPPPPQLTQAEQNQIMNRMLQDNLLIYQLLSGQLAGSTNNSATIMQSIPTPSFNSNLLSSLSTAATTTSAPAYNFSNTSNINSTTLGISNTYATGTNVASASASSSTMSNQQTSSHRLPSNGQSKDKRWMIRYEEMKQFQQRFGHCRVPHGYSENRKLSWWVMNQRAQYQNVQQGKKSWLTEKRVALLDEIGFDWNPIIGKSTPDETSKKKK